MHGCEQHPPQEGAVGPKVVPELGIVLRLEGHGRSQSPTCCSSLRGLLSQRRLCGAVPVGKRGRGQGTAVQHGPELSSARYRPVVKRAVHPHTTFMRMLRTWAVYHVYLGYPILVQRCPSKGAADKLAEEMGQSCD